MSTYVFRGFAQDRVPTMITCLTLVVSCIFRMSSTMSDTLLCSSCNSNTIDQHAAKHSKHLVCNLVTLDALMSQTLGWVSMGAVDGTTSFILW